MEYKLTNDGLIIRIDCGEEILTELKRACVEVGIKTAVVSAIGATDDFTVGVLDVKSKRYIARDYKGDHEILSLSGNITAMNGEYYAHLHMCAGGEDGVAVGGHLNRAVISATCEMFVRKFDGKVERKRDEETGLNIFDLSE